MKRGENEEAFQCLEASQAIDPDHPNVKRLHRDWRAAELMAALGKWTKKQLR
jgi:hypothetical protein